MTTKDFDKLGNECIDHLTALNPKGGIKVFVRTAVEFGYKRAVKNLTIHHVSNSLLPCGFDKCVIDIEGDKMCDFCKYKKQ